MTLRTRETTGVPNWPLILLEGPAQVGKSYQAAQFTGCDKVRQAYWMDFGEGAADEYGAVPGADYLIVEHDGTWSDIIGQLRDVRDEALKNTDGRPAVLVMDSMTNVWTCSKPGPTSGPGLRRTISGFFNPTRTRKSKPPRTFGTMRGPPSAVDELTHLVPWHRDRDRQGQRNHGCRWGRSAYSEREGLFG